MINVVFLEGNFRKKSAVSIVSLIIVQLSVDGLSSNGFRKVSVAGSEKDFKTLVIDLDHLI